MWGWLTFTALTALLVFLYPVVIAPLFNKFTPLEDRDLRNRIVTLGREAGVDIGKVLVADASKRTTAENAYVAGIGSSKQMVLYDTLLEAGGDDETLFVAAHELGHKKENHVVKGLIVVFRGPPHRLRDPLSPLEERLGVVVGRGRWCRRPEGHAAATPVPVVAGLVLTPVENTISRHNESTADDIAIDLTDDPDTAVATFRRLAFANLADLRPPQIAVWTLFSHPPIPERIGGRLSRGSWLALD